MFMDTFRTGKMLFAMTLRLKPDRHSTVAATNAGSHVSPYPSPISKLSGVLASRGSRRCKARQIRFMDTRTYGVTIL